MINVITLGSNEVKIRVKQGLKFNAREMKLAYSSHGGLDVLHALLAPPDLRLCPPPSPHHVGESPDEFQRLYFDMS